MQKIRRENIVRILNLAFVLFFLLTGCSRTRYNEGNFSSRIMGQGGQETSPLYYDFADVLIPGELTPDKSASFVYRTPGFTAGAISLKGRVDTNSLIAFFDSHMPKDGWIQVSSFKSPHTIMLFQKENKWCVISIFERGFSTRVDVRVAPTPPVTTIQEGDDGLFK